MTGTRRCHSEQADDAFPSPRQAEQSAAEQKQSRSKAEAKQKQDRAEQNAAEQSGATHRTRSLTQKESIVVGLVPS